MLNNILDKWQFRDYIEKDTIQMVQGELWIYRNFKQLLIIVLILYRQRELILNIKDFSIKLIWIKMASLAIKIILSSWGNILVVSHKFLKNNRKIQGQSLPKRKSQSHHLNHLSHPSHHNPSQNPQSQCNQNSWMEMGKLHNKDSQNLYTLNSKLQ